MWVKRFQQLQRLVHPILASILRHLKSIINHLVVTAVKRKSMLDIIQDYLCHQFRCTMSSGNNVFTRTHVIIWIQRIEEVVPDSKLVLIYCHLETITLDIAVLCILVNKLIINKDPTWRNYRHLRGLMLHNFSGIHCSVFSSRTTLTI